MTSVRHLTLQNMSVLPVGMHVTFIMLVWNISVIFMFLLTSTSRKNNEDMSYDLQVKVQ